MFFFGLLIVFITLLGPVRLRDPDTGELSAFVLIIPMFGGQAVARAARHGRKSRVFSARVDEQLFRYWQQFAQVIARFM